MYNSELLKPQLFHLLLTTFLLTICTYSLGWKCWMKINKLVIKTCLLYKFSSFRNNFTFITDINLLKPLIWMPELSAPKIDKTMLKSHYNSPWKITITFPNVFLFYVPMKNFLPALFYCLPFYHHLWIHCWG